MKRIIPVIAGLILVLGLMTGCGENQNQAGQIEPNSQGAQQQTETPTANTQTPSTQTPAQNTADASQFIGEEKAKEIALSQTGITAEGVIFDRVELDNDDGVWQYEIEFRKGNTEYDIDIKADDGTVLKSEKDIDD